MRVGACPSVGLLVYGLWASNESAKEAANGTHLAIRIDSLQFDEDSNETARTKIMVKGLTGIGLDAIGPDI